MFVTYNAASHALLYRPLHAEAGCWLDAVALRRLLPDPATCSPPSPRPGFLHLVSQKLPMALCKATWLYILLMMDIMAMLYGLGIMH